MHSSCFFCCCKKMETILHRVHDTWLKNIAFVHLCKLSVDTEITSLALWNLSESFWNDLKAMCLLMNEVNYRCFWRIKKIWANEQSCFPLQLPIEINWLAGISISNRIYSSELTTPQCLYYAAINTSKSDAFDGRRVLIITKYCAISMRVDFPTVVYGICLSAILIPSVKVNRTDELCWKL